MKKTFSIAFAVIISLNTLGYYGIFLCLHYRNDLAVTKTLDTDEYEISQTITLKIPVSIPYLADQTGFERVDGKFEHKGQPYRLVKQKYARDTLTVICVKDAESKKINDALTRYVHTFSDHATDHKPITKTPITFIKDYLPTTFSLREAASGMS